MFVSTRSVLYNVLIALDLMISCVASDQKQKIYLVTTGFRGIAGLYNKMPININVLLGQRLVDQQNLQGLHDILLFCLAASS